MRTLIRHGTIVTADDTRHGDVLVDGEQIAGVASSIEAPADRVIDATGRLVLPGGVDAHTHLDMPLTETITSADDFESGTIAAAFGGTTSIVDYATQSPGGSLRQALDLWRRKADGRAVIDYGFHMIVCHDTDQVEREMDALVGEGVSSFKFFMAAPIYIVHLSAADALEEVERARARGQRVFAETCPQYLFLSEEAYDEPGFAGAKYVMSPPLRAKASQDRLWQGLAGGSLQTVATDHCPFCLNEKARGQHDFSQIPNGAPGIETRLMLLFDGGVRTGRLTLNRFVEVTSTAPAQIFGLYPRKGSMKPGADADIVIWDPEKAVTISAATHHMKVDYSPYEGRRVTGAPEIVIARGQVIVERGTFVGRVGAGQFLKRAARQA